MLDTSHRPVKTPSRNEPRPNGSHSKPHGAPRTSPTAHVIDGQRTCRRQPDVSPGRRLARRLDSGGGRCNVRTVGESAAGVFSSTRGSTRTSIGRSLRYEGRIAAIRGLEWIINGGSLLKHAPLMPPHLRRSYPYASIPPRRRRGSTPVTFMCRSGSRPDSGQRRAWRPDATADCL
jgi:hypothetical protein